MLPPRTSKHALDTGLEHLMAAFAYHDGDRTQPILILLVQSTQVLSSDPFANESRKHPSLLLAPTSQTRAYRLHRHQLSMGQQIWNLGCLAHLLQPPAAGIYHPNAVSKV